MQRKNWNENSTTEFFSVVQTEGKKQVERINYTSKNV